MEELLKRDARVSENAVRKKLISSTLFSAP
jgi:hypothetical protein